MGKYADSKQFAEKKAELEDQGFEFYELRPGHWRCRKDGHVCHHGTFSTLEQVVEHIRSR